MIIHRNNCIRYLHGPSSGNEVPGTYAPEESIIVSIPHTHTPPLSVETKAWYKNQVYVFWLYKVKGPFRLPDM